MKKLLSVALVACFALTLTVGCGDSGTTKKSTGMTTTTSPTGKTESKDTKATGDGGAAPKGGEAAK